MTLTPNAKVAYLQRSSRMRPADSDLKGTMLYDHGYDFDLVNLTAAEHLVWLGKAPAEPAPDPVPEPGLTLESLEVEVKGLRSVVVELNELMGNRVFIPAVFK